MASKHLYKMVAVLGAGKFGTAVANLVAPNVSRVFLYTHKAERVAEINSSAADVPLAANVMVTTDLPMVLRTCLVIFPVVPAAKFRGLVQQMAPDLTSDHILIHGTKGLHLYQDGDTPLGRGVVTMSSIIFRETVVQQIGCLAGPNLSAFLAKKHPAVTVVASNAQSVLSVGEKLLTSDWLRVYLSSNLQGVEICSVLKNIFAIGAGIVGGMGYQLNTYAFFITSAISEMRYILTTMRIRKGDLLGPAGLGDLIATCGSTASRNYTIGYRLTKGEKLADILSTAKEVSEGVQTVQLIREAMQSYDRSAPMVEAIYRMLFEDLPLKEGVDAMLDG
ncbi:MAG: glycerol 3-phosphate dehydrogenase [Candidatus Cardinium sp.]|uniref:NAD(P)H-dependent glycerol-3-phosphate dehydrogenase n=1 Tax=Cardinium endosymbiont of Dermatophagoides farinae TaxID=2597823 RepID=UPI0011820A90|nr:NAD(P)H-dependent glycerol-3-phosphate dehydrogenase [Cardinium endosymbiont of Dermatophagoides farinae]TSJ80750.1 glycerol 3-phosphate dehydrogenase [Cardinium endosymbiont of Dermatophagoides farinae]UWW96749.1 MAG: glycerol 3-phosphate dehydrogenase [Candidatus Cardinium sp.]